MKRFLLNLVLWEWMSQRPMVKDVLNISATSPKITQTIN